MTELYVTATVCVDDMPVGLVLVVVVIVERVVCVGVLPKQVL